MRHDDLLRKAFGEILQRDHEMRLERVKADPAAHKLTRLFDGRPTTYRYLPAGKDGRGWEVRYCWSCWRNAAGYFLTWRELLPPKGSKAKFAMKRDQFSARKVRKRARALAEKRRDAFKDKMKA